VTVTAILFVLAIAWYLQGGEDSWDPLSLWVIFCKSDLYLVAILWKMICNLGDPMSLPSPPCISLALFGCLPLITLFWISSKKEYRHNCFLALIPQLRHFPCLSVYESKIFQFLNFSVFSSFRVRLGLCLKPLEPRNINNWPFYLPQTAVG